MTDERSLALVNDLLALPAEMPWLEFKHNNADPQTVGKRISALSNAARLADKDTAYMIWGVRNGSHEVVGTSFKLPTEKVGNQPLEFWLAQRIQPDIAFSFREVDHPRGRLVLLEVPAATAAPVEFEKVAYIRIGSATPRLADYPDRMRTLWSKMQSYAWESGLAKQFIDGDQVLALLDYSSYFDLAEQTLPDNRAGILDRLSAEKIITPDAGGQWNITNLGAVLFAKNLDDFDARLARKGVRLVAYDGNNRAAGVIRRQDGKRGYAAGFQGLIDYINGLLPQNEHIAEALRTQAVIFPGIAVRELAANALIHQDMTIRGAGPLIELFTDRLEITNPGASLISPDRFIDSPPRSRNETLAALMRRMRLCEEQGTGIDKVVAAVELFQLPPPDFRVEDSATRTVLFAPRRFADMTSDERIRACYQHAALRYVSGEVMKNATLRERFGIEARNSAQVSQVIRAALARGLIRPADSAHPKSGYFPSWV